MKKIIMLILGFIIQMVSFALNVTPTYFDKQITKEDTGYMEYTIKNDSPEKVRYKINFTPSNKEDMSELDITVYPKVVMLEPYSSKIVKVLVKSKDDLKKNEYKFQMEYNPIIVPTIGKEKKMKNNEAAIQVEIGMGLVIEMTGFKLNPEDTKIDIKNIKIKDGEINFELVNIGELSAKTYLLLEDSDGKNISFELNRVKAKGRKEFSFKLDKEKINIKHIKEFRIYSQDESKILYEERLK